MTSSDKKNQQNSELVQKSPEIIFYAIKNLIRTILNKARKSAYDKDKVFVNFYNQLGDKNFYQNNNLPLVSLFVNNSTLYSISKPFELLQADIAGLRFLEKLAVDPKYCLLVVDLFTSKICVYLMRNRILLARKLKLFYEDIMQKRTGRMRSQTDLEFKQNQIKK